jgi:hypothetical protein
VVAEYVSLLGLVHAAAERLSGRGTGWLAAAAAAATPLLTGSVAIGQETGFTALAVAGQLVFFAACPFLAERAGCLCIDPAGDLARGLGGIHGRVGRRVDDRVGAQAAHGGPERRQVREVAARATGRDEHLSQRRQRALQFPADLALRAQQQQLHRGSRPS